MENLNEFQLKNVEGSDLAFKDNSIVDDAKSINVFFRNIEEELIKQIDQADGVFGCVAWLTNETILKALSFKDYVSIIVQKEDFLRPDTGSRNDDKWKKKLNRMYSSLNNSLTRYEMNNILPHISYLGDPSIEPIRCVGNHNTDKKPAFPRMHNKFLVFAKIEFDEKKEINNVIPYAVWTGSFNLTKNSTNSLENAVLIKDKPIVDAFYQEYGQIAAMSESLDWESDWISPEWRIGS